MRGKRVYLHGSRRTPRHTHVWGAGKELATWRRRQPSGELSRHVPVYLCSSPQTEEAIYERSKPQRLAHERASPVA